MLRVNAANPVLGLLGVFSVVLNPDAPDEKRMEVTEVIFDLWFPTEQDY